MLIVLDTNVIISALLSSKGAPAAIINLWEDKEFDIAISPPLLEELERVLNYKRVKKYFQEPQEKIALLLKRLKMISINTDPKVKLNVIEDDPDYDRILECAVAANASYIISGDKHLLSLEKYQGIIILPPAGFLALLKLQSPT